MTIRQFTLALTITALSSFATTAARTPSQGGCNYYSHSTSLEIYDSYSVDEEACFPGGENAMLKFINGERRYPSEAYQRGIQGRVMCRFVIQPDGKISDIEVIRGVEQSLDDEAVRIINEMPVWRAAKVNDSPVHVYYILTIPFRL